jgi:hypothetical protein
MGPEYSRYFEGRLESARDYATETPFGEEVYDAIRRGVEAADLPPHLRVRPDAEFFLLLNFYEFVVSPATAVEDADAQQLIGELVPTDVRQIVESAAQRVADQGGAELSGHDVVQALADNWDRLAFVEFLRWEK